MDIRLVAGGGILFLLLAVVIFLYNASLQYQEFRVKSNLQPLKRFFFSMSIILAGSNALIVGIFGELTQGHSITPFMEAGIILTYSASMLIVAVLFLVVYRFRLKDE